MDRIDKFIDGLEEMFTDIRERHVDDSVCGLCEYDGAYVGVSGEWCNECPGFDKDDCFKLSAEIRKEWKAQLSQEGTTKDATSDLISRQAAIDALMKRDKELRNINWYDKPYAEGECRGIDEALAIVSNLPSAQPEIIYCKDCKHHWTHKCMDSIPMEMCDLEQTFYDAEHDFCSLAERREETT